ncbi:MAG: NAD-dependent epimerase/dehydratase family protein [Deltaproteobacteria bacterium]|nr:NAD-dependent epimerase/dehydratase family protein [Deltaproteobacteria bacterium]
MNILITGGAGFVGSRLALLYRERYPQSKIFAFDNLRRRGSELNLPMFKQHNIQFVHGDIRQPSDFTDLRIHPDLFIEASAEPSVHAGIGQDPRYVFDTNLGGTFNCLEFARKQSGTFVFLSTSRVYAIDALREIPLVERKSRFAIDETKLARGLTGEGITEEFETRSARSLYGCTKLCSEYLVQEYTRLFSLKAVINRCGVIAGAGQFGKVDQGVFTMWVANHIYGKELTYMGFKGTGKQVRDLLHPSDLFTCIEAQAEHIERINGDVFNVGGGLAASISLLELTRLCQEITGQELVIHRHPETNPVDVPYYVSDTTKVQETLGWQPAHPASYIIRDIAGWIGQNKKELAHLFA